MIQWTTGHQRSPSRRSAEASVVSTESSMSGSVSGSVSGSGSGSGSCTLEYDLPPKPSTLEQVVNNVLNNHVRQRQESVQWGVHRGLLQRTVASVKYGTLCVLCFVFCVLCFVFCVLCVIFCVQHEHHATPVCVMPAFVSLSRSCFRCCLRSSFPLQEP